MLRKVNINKRTIIDDVFCIFLVTLFMVIGILLKRNEIFQDPWYMEAIADGTFGNDIHSIFTLGSNFVVLGLIYILSLSGIRLFWYHFLLLGTIFITSYIWIKQILNTVNKTKKYIIAIICMCICIYCTLMYDLYYSVVATYSIMVGCMLILQEQFYSKRPENIKNIVFGVILAVWGICIRFDAIVYGIAFVGVLWIFEIISLRNIKRKEFNIRLILKKIVPYMVIILFTVLTVVVQRIGMKIENDNFYEWNELRAEVEDYPLGDYSKYKEIGLSENDINFLEIWGLDEDYFTIDKLYEIKSCKKDDKNRPSVEYVLERVIETYQNEPLTYAVIVLSICILLFCSKGKSILQMLSVNLVLLMAEFYFVSLSKGAGSVFHVNLSLFYIDIIALIFIFTNGADRLCSMSEIKQLIIIIFMMKLILLTGAWNYNSILNKYVERRYAQDSYFMNIKYGETFYKPYTYNQSVSEYIQNDKDSLYIIPFTRVMFAQTYPLITNSYFTMDSMSSAENVVFIGQYESFLKTQRVILENYNISGLVSELVKDNVKIVVRTDSMEKICNVIELYLKEHYYHDASYEVIDIVDNCSVVKFSEK